MSETNDTNGDSGFAPQKAGKPARKPKSKTSPPAHARNREYGKVGRRAVAETPLYEPCPLRGGDVPCAPGCVCGGTGFVATGYTTERLDRMQTEVDRCLVALDELRPALRQAREDCEVGMEIVVYENLLRQVDRFLVSREDAVAAARDRLAAHARGKRGKAGGPGGPAAGV